MADSFPRMTAAEVLEVLRRHHRGAALVPEVVIGDGDYWLNPVDGDRKYTRRIDALMFDSLVRTAIEIKVSVADAKRDSYGKLAPWLKVCHRVYYAVPAGMIEHPPVYNAGLWWVWPDGRVEVKKKAKLNQTPEPLPQHVVQALAYRAVGRSSIG